MSAAWLERVERELRAPVPVPPGFEARVISAVRRSGGRRITAFGGAAMLVAAALVAAVGLALGDRSGVEFQIEVPAASAVSVVGDFNDWDQARTPLARVDGTTRWRARLTLPRGLYRYAFLVDGQRWLVDPDQPVSPDPDFGTEVSMVSVAAEW